MKKTEPGSSAVRKDAMSAFRSSAGPAVWTIGAPSSAAMMWASEVLPSPGGPDEQDVVERLVAALRGLDEDLELGRDLRLGDEVAETARAQRAVELLVGCRDPDLRHRLGDRVVEPAAADARIAGDAHAASRLPPEARSAAAISSSGVSPPAPSSSFSASARV